MKRLRFLGHPIHPPATHLPLGLLMSAPVWDLAAWGTGAGTWWFVSYWTLAAGAFFSLPTIVTGVLDFLSLKAGPAAEKIAFRHMGLMAVAIGLVVASLLMRGSPAPAAGMRAAWAAGLSAAAAGLLALGGWYGGRLVYEHGAGVEPAGDK